MKDFLSVALTVFMDECMTWILQFCTKVDDAGGSKASCGSSKTCLSLQVMQSITDRLGTVLSLMGTFFELGKDKAAKGEGWAPPFISCAQDTVGL